MQGYSVITGAGNRAASYTTTFQERETLLDKSMQNMPKNSRNQYIRNRMGTILTKLPYIIQFSIVTYTPPNANKKRMSRKN